MNSLRKKQIEKLSVIISNVCDIDSSQDKGALMDRVEFMSLIYVWKWLELGLKLLYKGNVGLQRLPLNGCNRGKFPGRVGPNMV